MATNRVGETGVTDRYGKGRGRVGNCMRDWSNRQTGLGKVARVELGRVGLAGTWQLGIRRPTGRVGLAIGNQETHGQGRTRITGNQENMG